MLTAVAHDLMLSLESQRIFQNLHFVLFCYITNHLMTELPWGTVNFVSLKSQKTKTVFSRRTNLQGLGLD